MQEQFFWISRRIEKTLTSKHILNHFLILTLDNQLLALSYRTWTTLPEWKMLFMNLSDLEKDFDVSCHLLRVYSISRFLSLVFFKKGTRTRNSDKCKQYAKFRDFWIFKFFRVYLILQIFIKKLAKFSTHKILYL